MGVKNIIGDLNINGDLNVTGTIMQNGAPIGGGGDSDEPIDPVQYRSQHRNVNWPAMPLPSEMTGDDKDRVLLLYDATAEFCAFAIKLSYNGTVNAKAEFYNNTSKYGEETISFTSGTITYFQYDKNVNYNYVLVVIEANKGVLTGLDLSNIAKYNNISLNNETVSSLLEVSGRTKGLNLSMSGSPKKKKMEFISFVGLDNTNMSSMFDNCTSLESIPELDTSKVTNMGSMFSYCTSLKSMPKLNTSNVANMSSMFNNCISLKSIPELDTSNVINISYMFNYCYSLQSVPLLNTSNATNMSSMFNNCYSLQSVPLLNTSKVTDMSNMFGNCTSLKSIPKLDTSNVTNMNSMFGYCQSLQSVPRLDTSNVTKMNSMFSNCYSLQSIPLLNTSKVTNMSSMFNYCYSLQSVPELDTSRVTNMGNIFYCCYSLVSILSTNMSVWFGISSSSLFDTDALVTILNNLATISSTQTLTMGSTLLNKLTAEQKAIATNKGWTLA